ncbi:MAG: acyl carrier protein [Bacteroides uniformis]
MKRLRRFFQPDTNYRELDEWSSLTALSIISMVDENFDLQLTGADLRSAKTIEELFDIIQNK